MRPEEFEQLRRRAEEFLGTLDDERQVEQALELKRLLYELEVHQVELQLQNEDLRAAQLGLELSRGRYAALYGRAPVGYLTIDQDGFIVEANDTAAQILPSTRPLIGRRVLDFAAPDDRDVLYLHFRRVLSFGGIDTCEVRGHGVGLEGHVLELRSQVAVEVGPGRRLWTTVNDVTERSRMVAALQENEARFRAVFESALDGILVVDARGVIESCNAAARGIFRASTANLVGRSALSLLPGLRLDQATEDAAISTRFEFSARRADGLAFLAEIGVSHYQRGDLQMSTLFVRDISEARAAEREHRQSQKMAAVGRLASGIAHDFNNLLMAISGCADAAIELLPGESRARSLVERAREAALRGANLTRGLLVFGRKKEDDGLDARSNLDAVVRRMDAILRHLVGHDVELEIDLGLEGIWATIDETEVEQILINLLGNGRDASEPGGRLYLETHASDDSDMVVLCVRDEGSGMDEETRARIFEPFFTTKAVGEGTGLGLATVHAIVERRGGRIELESTVGHGTSVTVLLRRAAPPAPARAEREPSRVPLSSGATVLLVEDEPLVRESIARYLERAHLSVLVARDGSEALRVAEDYDGPIDLLLTDIVLPQVTGDVVMRRVAELRPGTQQIAMSALSAQDLREAGRLGPDTEMLSKPFTEADLLRAVQGRLSARAANLRKAFERRAGDHLGCLVLLIEDDEDIRVCLLEHFAELGLQVLGSHGGEDALSLFRDHREQLDLIVADFHLAPIAGPDLVARMREDRPDVPALFVSGDVLAAQMLGESVVSRTTAFLEKPVALDQLDREMARLLSTTCGLRRAPAEDRAQASSAAVPGTGRAAS